MRDFLVTETSLFQDFLELRLGLQYVTRIWCIMKSSLQALNKKVIKGNCEDVATHFNAFPCHDKDCFMLLMLLM